MDPERVPRQATKDSASSAGSLKQMRKQANLDGFSLRQIMLTARRNLLVSLEVSTTFGACLACQGLYNGERIEAEEE